MHYVPDIPITPLDQAAISQVVQRRAVLLASSKPTIFPAVQRGHTDEPEDIEILSTHPSELPHRRPPTFFVCRSPLATRSDPRVTAADDQSQIPRDP
jgi:hypothetical protein